MNLPLRPQATTSLVQITFSPPEGRLACAVCLSVSDFVRVISCQTVSREGMRRIAKPAIALAATEGLRGHAESLRVRWSDA